MDKQKIVDGLEKVKDASVTAAKATAKGAKKAGKITKDVAVKAKDVAVEGTNKVVKFTEKEWKLFEEKVDYNKNGKIDIEDIIYLGFTTPGININRSEFLRKELKNVCTEDIIENAIETNPMQAGIPLETINKVASDLIQHERLMVSGISAALGMPGGIAVVATAVADLAQFYGYMIRAIQELLYLYGFPEIEVKEDGAEIDAGTMNLLILCMGTMYGVAGASNAIKILSASLGKEVTKRLPYLALTKTFFYPILKDVLKWFDVKLTEKLFATYVGNAIPVIGGIIGGGITYAMFKPCCERLQKELKNTMLSNPNYKVTKEDKEFIETEFKDVTE